MDNRDYEKALDKCWNKFCESQPTLSKQAGVLTFFNFIFDYLYHVETPNLTSDAEGEEKLTVSRKVVLEEYRESINKAHPYNINSYNRGFHVGCATTLKTLFGSKCLPDETPLSQNPPENCDKANHISTDDNKPAKPKFKVGDIAVVRGFKHPLLEHDGAIVTILSYHEKGDLYSCAIAPNVGIDVDAKYLEPYTEPEKESRNLSQNITNYDKQFDNILKDSLSKERRLSIATQIMSAILSNQRMLNNLASGETTAEGVVKSIVNTTMMYTDALMVEAEKGGNHV